MFKNSDEMNISSDDSWSSLSSASSYVFFQDIPSLEKLLKSSAFYIGVATTVQVQERLQKLPHGAYLVRYSLSAEKYYICCYRNGKLLQISIDSNFNQPSLDKAIEQWLKLKFVSDRYGFEAGKEPSCALIQKGFFSISALFKTCPYFFESIKSTKAAYDFLSKQAPGSFIIRYSTRNQQYYVSSLYKDKVMNTSIGVDHFKDTWKNTLQIYFSLKLVREKHHILMPADEHIDNGIKYREVPKITLQRLGS